MRFPTRTFLRDGLMLALLAVGVAGLIALVTDGRPWPKLFREAPAAVAAKGQLPPPPPMTIRQAETKDALLLQAAFDRIGFDLDAVAAGYISVPRVVLTALPANLERIGAIDERKAVFLRTLLPVVLEVNMRLSEDRARLLALKDKLGRNIRLSGDDVGWVMALADRYDETGSDIDALVRKVDAVPVSLALAQAIEESGWGMSRIARGQNALFGQFGQEDDDQEPRYRRFATLTETVEAYAHNLNTHRAYREFRALRARMRGKTGEIDAQELAGTLHRYSERRGEYVQSLRSIMRDNTLLAFDGARLAARRASSAVIESRAGEATQVASD